jgi:hypothetical protein
MDPYLEDSQVWPTFHHQFVHRVYQILLPGLVERYQARISQRHYVTEQVPPTDQHEDCVEVLERGTGKLITLLDVVSPANKTTAAGRTAYLDKRQEGREAGANLVEIDLVLQGQPTLEYSRDGLPDWDYAVTVTRSTQPERYEIYTATLQKRLPRFRLPLASDDRDTVLDLHAAFVQCYAEGAFAKQVDYKREPPAPLSEDKRRWLDTLLRESGRRKRARSLGQSPSHDEIARMAYSLWLQEGCPHGRDREHWLRAEEQWKQEHG